MTITPTQTDERFWASITPTDEHPDLWGVADEVAGGITMYAVSLDMAEKLAAVLNAAFSFTDML